MGNRRNQELGQWGEEQAGQFLARHHFSLVERNFHTTVGEIDIIAAKGGDYYFIEVKTRTTAELATDLAVTPAKQRKLRKTIKQYCYRRGLVSGSFVLAILLVLVNRATKVVKFRLAVVF